MLNSNPHTMNKTLTEQIEDIMRLNFHIYTNEMGDKIVGFERAAKAIEAILDEIIKERDDAVYAKLNRCKRLYQELYEEFQKLNTPKQ